MNRTSNRRPASAALGLAAALLATSSPVLADWLVTREGARVETRGPWQEKGKLVVFTLRDGTLSSLRADLVDLEASRRVTAEAKVKAEPRPAPAAKPKRRSVRSLTDKDFRQAGASAVEGTIEGTTDGQAPAGEAAAPDAGAGAKDAAAPPDAEPRSKLEVVSWERAGAVGQGIRLTGLLRNNSEDQVTGIELEAGLYDESGALLVRKGADLESVTLAPGETTPFLVDVPDTVAFSAIKFLTRSSGFKLRALPPPGPAT